MTNSKNGATAACGAQDALSVFMARSIAIVEKLKGHGGDGISEPLKALEEAEDALRGLGASDYFISRLSWLVIEALSDDDYGFNRRSVDISVFADFLSDGREWDA